MDSQYVNLSFQSQSLEHKYGENVHLCSNPYWISLLNRFSTDALKQPELNFVLRQLYSQLLAEAVGTLVDCKAQSLPTRMAGVEPKAVLHGEMIEASSRFVIVDLARAGILPTLVCFENLSSLVEHTQVRQDHFYVNRKTNDSGEVIGVDVSGSKIGGPQQDSWVFFPDPMGATGSSLSHAVSHYKESVKGKAKGYIALHLIVTPEYIARMKKDHPDVHIFALRLDRGLSSEDVLSSIPGENWDKEVGLTENDYIVPGAGGVGEVLNNSYV